ncbi:hypothetical protein VOI45_04155 [Acidaminococcus fermentans]|uniref:hypothetical protein n=1 Tax=Acidaminococcus fermentans TaxID=905 RepID=UPI002E791AD2|nr:hypothetical protein [Acidaminococcus fermentans]MEE1597977.1 hypothetical protein [Acidaminococcus fermentans]MEE4122239.1 hypothetical protein [Acidaminococcus fermentans]
MKNMKAIAMTLALVAGITGTAFAADIREIVGDPGNEITDRNPTCYQSRMVHGHLIESYVENDVAVTKKDSDVVILYEINHGDFVPFDQDSNN